MKTKVFVIISAILIGINFGYLFSKIVIDDPNERFRKIECKFHLSDDRITTKFELAKDSYFLKIRIESDKGCFKAVHVNGSEFTANTFPYVQKKDNFQNIYIRLPREVITDGDNSFDFFFTEGAVSEVKVSIRNYRKNWKGIYVLFAPLTESTSGMALMLTPFGITTPFLGAIAFLLYKSIFVWKNRFTSLKTKHLFFVFVLLSFFLLLFLVGLKIYNSGYMIKVTSSLFYGFVLTILAPLIVITVYKRRGGRNIQDEEVLSFPLLEKGRFFVSNKYFMFLVVLILLSIAYLPLLREDFVFNDDCFLLEMDGPLSTHPQYNFLITIGRPLFMFLGYPVWRFVETVGDLNTGRLINVLMLSVCAFVFCRWLQRNCLSLFESLMLTTVAFTLPVFQTQVYLVNSFPHMVGLLAAMCAGITAYKGSHTLEGNWKNIFNRYTAGAVILLFLSMTIYTPLAMFYWVVLAAALLNLKTWNFSEKLRWVYLFGIAFFTMGIYFVFAKLTYSIFSSSMEIRSDIIGSHHVQLTDNILDSVSLFWTAFLSALGIWNVIPIEVFTLLMYAIIVGGITLAVIQSNEKSNENRKGDLKSSILTSKGFILIILFPLAMLPNLVATYNHLSYRMITSVCVLTVLVLYLFVRKFVFMACPGKVRGFLLGAILSASVFTAIYSSQSNLSDFIVSPAGAELEYIKSELLKADLAEVNNIHIIRPREMNCLAAEYDLEIGRDEYGLLTSTFSQNITGLVYGALLENGAEPDYIDNVEITSGTDSNTNLAEDSGILIIDMNNVYEQLTRSKPI